MAVSNPEIGRLSERYQMIMSALNLDIRHTHPAEASKRHTLDIEVDPRILILPDLYKNNQEETIERLVALCIIDNYMIPAEDILEGIRRYRKSNERIPLYKIFNDIVDSRDEHIAYILNNYPPKDMKLFKEAKDEASLSDLKSVVIKLENEQYRRSDKNHVMAETFLTKA